MKAILDWNSKKFEIDFDEPMDISIPMESGLDNPNAFHIPFPRFEPIQVGDFVGSVMQGGSANCENLFINAHGNGTHTECIGHITKERIAINDCLSKFHFMAQLITVEPAVLENGDHVIVADPILEKLIPEIVALVLRSKPNTEEKLRKQYSGNNPIYIDKELTSFLAKKGIQHLLVDIPSVDREEDGGEMAAHNGFWQYPENPRTNATITEMIFVPNEIEDGTYLLNIQIASLRTDASPSKPVLYKITEIN